MDGKIKKYLQSAVNGEKRELFVLSEQDSWFRQYVHEGTQAKKLIMTR